MRSAFVTGLIASARLNPNLWLLTADLGYSFLERFSLEFPDRFVNVGVAEQNLISIAAGLALAGKKVVVYSIINFITFRCLEQIRLDICYHQLDVCIVGVGAGYFYGSQGYSHHGIEDLALMRALPHIKIYSPMNDAHTTWMTEQLLLEKGPTYLRLGRHYEGAPSLTYTLDEGLVVRQGQHVMLIALGEDVIKALQIADRLEKKEILAGVMTFPRVKPLDEKMLMTLVEMYPHLVVIETHVEGGLSTACIESMVKHGCHRKLQVFRLPSLSPCVEANPEDFLERAGLSVEAIVGAITKQC